ncbi:AAA family ATPase [Rhizobium mesosinicum]|uniref:AAA family ATPase n=1 Tax=Rhizobium mesosinicum TaxID=335017 RepID=A0ABS7GM74_9HYPH|nr:AAA family ATPase [Rhizobium mesosinicum]MBW9051097.1 AAA family ATPase [Rhizobium mesosinicum]
MTEIASRQLLQVDLGLALFRDGDSASSRLTLELLDPTMSGPALARLENEIAVSSHLMPPYAPGNRVETSAEDVKSLVMDDPGGIPLRQVVDGPIDLPKFLRLAIALTRTVGDLHDRRIVHGDIRPEAFLLDGETLACLIGFGSARRTSDLQETPLSRTIEDSRLPYVSPEQTGRMDHQPDYRSDLYSLGITFYEMLSGRLPFVASTSTEWIHAHLARQPLPLGRWVPNVPAPIAAIIFKLLSKQPSERYQTGRGLQADLERCLADWDQLGFLQAFPLGERDARDRLLIPERLYGREIELSRLKSEFLHVKNTGRSRVVLVSGYSGVGKSALVNGFRKTLETADIVFAAGKFDQVKRQEPFSTLVEALTDVITDISGLEGPVRANWCARLSSAVGNNGSLIAKLVPEITKLIGAQPELPSLPPAEAQGRFRFVLTRFLEAFSRPGNPLVLFLDDLQWVDSATLEVMDRIVTSADENILLIGAYRDNEISAGHPLFEWLAKVGRNGDELESLTPLPLDEDVVTQLVADALGCPTGTAETLARVIHSKSGGNPLFATQLLTSLVDGGKVCFDPVARQWVWNADDIERAATDDIVELISAKLLRLSPDTRSVLNTIACLGNVVSDRLLHFAFGETAKLDGSLREAIIAGLLYRRKDSYAFFHDRVQEAAYRLASPAELIETHLGLGRRLHETIPHDQREGLIFDIVNQYNRGFSLIDEKKEKLALAELNLQAARKAEQSAAYSVAQAYHAFGTRLADLLTCGRSRRLLFEFELGLAECEFIGGQGEQAQARLDALAARTENPVDRARIAYSQITLCTALGQLGKAIEICLSFMRENGVDWEAAPTREQVLAEFEPIRAEIAERQVESRLSLPDVEEPAIRGLLEVLAASLPPAFFSNENLVCLILCRMANLAKAAGNTAASPLGYAYLGMVLGPYFGDYAAGYRFGKLGHEMSMRPGFERFRGRVAMTFAYHVLPYSEPIRDGSELLKSALQISQESGDLTYAGFSTCTTVSSMLAAGDSLATVERRAGFGLEFVRSINFGLIADIVTSQLMMVRCLQGLTFSLDSFDDGEFDEGSFESRLIAEPGLSIARCWHWIRKLQASVISSDFKSAVAFGQLAEPLLWTTGGHLELPEFYFYDCVARSQVFTTSANDASEQIGVVETRTQKLSELAQNCPENFSAQAALAEAELARIKGRSFEALKGYDAAIELAATHGLPHIEALANELTARFCTREGLSTLAKAHWERSYSAYRKWGANGKLRALEVVFPDLRPSQTSIASAIVDVASPWGSVDLETVVRTSSAVSEETVHSRMIRTLMIIALESAGAQRGLLLLPRNDSIWIEAEAKAEGEAAEVTFRRELLSGDAAPARSIREAFRSHEPVIFQSDGGEGQNCAALALPLVARGKAVGLLYLENKLNSHAFSPARIAVLKLLAAQTAISIENSSLDEKESLLREVHHRVKNNLQLISSLLNLQANRIDDPSVAELFAESRNRVRSMALVHENLYRAGSFARIAMGSHIQTLCSHLARAYVSREKRISIEVEVDDVDLDLDRAIACGLIVNELVSNALKHGFSELREGVVNVALRWEKPNDYILVVRDNGVGLSSESGNNDTLGLQLVRDLVDQLRGTMEVRNAPGAGFTIRFSVNATGSRK